MKWTNALIFTPASFQELEGWILDLPPKDRQLAVMVAGMTWNLAAKLQKEALENIETASSGDVKTKDLLGMIEEIMGDNDGLDDFSD